MSKAGSMTYQLPPGNSPSLALVQPTQAEILTQGSKNAVMWRGALSLEAYLRREKHLSQQPYTREGGITHWALVDTSVPPSERIVLAGCETLRKRGLVSRNGQVQEVVCHGIGSVFSAEEFRGRGFGKRMVQELGIALQTWQADGKECGFSTLYSDIGKSFYVKLGWPTFPSAHIHLPPKAAAPTNGHSKKWFITPLYAADLPALCALDEKLVRSKLEQYTKGTAIAIVPDYPTIEWHHAREEFVSDELIGRKPLIKGVMARTATNGGEQHQVWCIWTHMWYNPDVSQSKGNTLHILRLVIVNEEGISEEDAATSPEDVDLVAAMLQQAQQEAAEWGMEEVEIWNPHPRTLMAAEKLDTSVKVVHRDEESIASLRWHGEKENLTWLENEKYAWC